MSKGAPWRVLQQRMIRARILDPRVLLAIYCLAAVVVTLIKLAPGQFVENGYTYRPIQNFAIFRNSFYHLIHGQNLYAAYPGEQWDLYRYSPTFGLLFAPFALLPYSAGVLFWNVANACALFCAVWSIPSADERKRAFVLWFTLLALLTATGNSQSNALVAALMIGAWSAQERKKTALSAALIALSVCVKPFGIFALVPCLLVEGRKRLIARTAASGLLLGALPLLAVSPAHLAVLYRNWYTTVSAFNQSRPGMSVMGLLSTWFGRNPPNNAVIAVGACILVAVTLIGVRRGDFRDAQFRMLTAASALIFVTIFNYAAESPTYVIAVAGVGLWFVAQPASGVNAVLLALVFLFSELSSSSLFPRQMRHDLFEPYVIKAVPCILVWMKLQWDLLRFGRTRENL
jgi:hypothetical protein